MRVLDSAVKVYDLVIIGGGMSGLALARELINQGITQYQSLAIIESRDDYQQDKIWSFWNIEEENYDTWALASWDGFELYSEQNEITINCREFPYISIDSAKYYSYHFDLIANDPNATIYLGIQVSKLKELDGGIEIHSTDGLIFRTSRIFDSRVPTSLPNGKFDLLQHFKGVHIKTSTPNFQTKQVTLMDFRTDQSTGLNFIYVLPFSENEVLIEATWFSHNLVDSSTYDKHLDTYLQKQNITDYEIIYEETGIIPMTTNIPQQTTWQKINRIGTAGGVTRPSTGYTFLLAQKHASRIARAMREEQDWPVMHSRWTHFLDDILLRVLSKHPTLGPEIFVQLFERNPAERMIRFLSGTSSKGDDLKLMRRVPYMWAFVKEAMFSFFNRLMFWKS